MEQALAWLSRWGVSLASLGGGLLTLLVFRRGLPNVGWIVGYLLLLWLLFAVFIEMRQALAGSERKSRRLIVSAVDYTIQTSTTACSSSCCRRITPPPHSPR